jgi:3'-5' exoribonuclease
MEEPHDPRKGPWISDLKIRDKFVGHYLLREAKLETFRDPTRGRYLRLLLADRTGRIEARVWENAEDTASALSQVHVVKLEGEIEEYLDRLQVRVLRVRAAAEDEYDRADLQPATDRDVGAMMAEIESAIAGLQNPHLAALLRLFFDDAAFRSGFSTAPAATRIHQAYLGGLLEHTYETLLLSRPLVELYPEIDRELLTAGILLHDIGKLDEFAWDLNIEYTDQGRLLGHVVIGAERIDQAIASLPEFPADLRLALRHMILAHHGHYEWGSPRRPKTLEAVALHHLENLDGQVNRFRALIEAARQEGRSWTDYDRELGRSLYAGGDADLPIEESGPVS